MTKAFPLRRPQHGECPALAIPLALLLLLCPLGAQASWGQADDSAPAKKDSQPKGKASNKVGAAKAEAEVKADAPPTEPDVPDRWQDPRAEAALPNTFPELKPVTSSVADTNLIDQLSRGQGQMDLAVIDRYVRSRAAELTSRSNIKALMDPAAKVAKPKALELAASDLIRPLTVPSVTSNQGFRREYVKKLVEVFEPVWKGHLHSRTMAMIVLSRSGEVGAMPTFTAQLKDPNQVAIVKLLAAVGVTNVAHNGRKDVEDAAATPAAVALAGFLAREPEVFWPVQFRAVEALGSLRLATEKPLEGKAEFAQILLGLAADPKAAPTVRAWAAWALGMLRVPTSVKNYNFSLVANVMGNLACDIASKIAVLPDDAQSKMVLLSDLLVQIHLGLAGNPEVRNSGLIHATHPAMAMSQSYVSDVEKRVRAVAKAALEVGNAAKGEQMKSRRAALVAASDDLRAFVAKPLGNGRSLWAGSPALPEFGPPKVAAGVR